MQGNFTIVVTKNASRGGFFFFSNQEIALRAPGMCGYFKKDKGLVKTTVKTTC